MQRPKVTILKTGSANLASVLAAFERLGCTTEVTSDPGETAKAEWLVVPGVGAFEPVVRFLKNTGLDDVLRTRIEAGRATLAICLGLQILADSSEEGQAQGLGVFAVPVRRFPNSVVVPQLGWNRVQTASKGGFLDDGDAYFANSFCIDRVPEGWSAAWANHGEPFVAALERGAVLACQFHPELSGQWGESLLKRWLEQSTPQNQASKFNEKQVSRETNLMRRVIPCLDVDSGRVVKGVKFSNLRDAGDPVELARNYAQQGADELVLLDVSATPEGRGNALDTVKQVRRVLDIPLTVGGGIRTLRDAEALLNAGADKIAVNTAAVTRPELLRELADRFGCQCTVLALDAATHEKGWRVVVRSGQDHLDLDVIRWSEFATQQGAGEILLTSWDRDGTQSGYDLDLLKAVSKAVAVPVIASGGARNAAHMAEAIKAGADAVLAASILHDGDSTVGTLKARLKESGVEVRT
jgi:cyclase